MLKALFADSFAGYLVILAIVGSLSSMIGWAVYWKKKGDEERASS
jgi:hypothetical protein